MPNTQKTAMITVCGRPNVGKSTLTNALVGEKIAIVSNKPQTTRNRIAAVVCRGSDQFVFLDTPGLHTARTRLGDYMVGVVHQSVSDVDAALLLVDPIANVGGPEAELIEELKKRHIPTILGINKIDTVEKEKLLAVIAAYASVGEFAAVLPISAKEGDGVSELLGLLEGYLPEGPWLFPEGMTTDQPERQVCAEILREKLLLCLDKEVPHGTAVEITKFSEREDEVIEVDATIYCEKDSHKGIIIGKGGTMIKRIGTEARKDLELLLGAKVFLDLSVKVRKNWRRDANQIRRFGYGEGA